MQGLLGSVPARIALHATLQNALDLEEGIALECPKGMLCFKPPPSVTTHALHQL